MTLREKTRNAKMKLVGKPVRKKPLGRPSRRWEEHVKLDLTVIKTEYIG